MWTNTTNAEPGRLIPGRKGEIHTNKFTFYRKRAGYTQEQVAALLKVRQNNVSHWETGMCYPRVPILLKLAKLYGCKVDDLLT